MTPLDEEDAELALEEEARRQAVAVFSRYPWWRSPCRLCGYPEWALAIARVREDPPDRPLVVVRCGRCGGVVSLYQPPHPVEVPPP